MGGFSINGAQLAGILVVAGSSRVSLSKIAVKSYDKALSRIAKDLSKLSESMSELMVKEPLVRPCPEIAIDCIAC